MKKNGLLLPIKKKRRMKESIMAYLLQPVMRSENKKSRKESSLYIDFQNVRINKNTNFTE